MTKKAPVKKNYWEVHIDHLPAHLETEITHFLFEWGCAGTTQKLEFKQPSLVYEATIEKQDVIHMICYFDLTLKETVAPLLQNWVWQIKPEQNISIQWVMQKEQDWMHEWKKYFKPFKIKGMTVLPSWHFNSKKHDRKKSIIIDPGMAFGTGHHATTRFALMNLKLAPVKKLDVLDVGAGSGILSVAAEKWGAKKVVAIDNDPECWRESRKTFKLNKTKKCEASKKQLEQIKQNYDVVIANIIDGVLISLRESLWARTKDQGYLVLSGILTVGASAFLRDFCQDHNYKLISELQDAEWTSFLIQKL